MSEARTSRRSVLVTRLTFGIPILAVVVGLLLLDRGREGGLGVGILAVVFGVGAIIEFARMFRLGRGVTLLSVLLLLLLTVGRIVELPLLAPDLSFAEAALLLPLLVLLVPAPRDGAEASFGRGALSALLGVSYIGLPLVALVDLAGDTDWGVSGLLFLLLVVKGNDSGAYLVGRRWGRTPLTRISPKKTVEGSAGGLVLGVGIGLVLHAVGLTSILGLGQTIGLSAAIGVLGQLGDLLESALKRRAGVKDSGALIPAFGGILDLLDSLLLAGPLLLLVAIRLGL